MPLIIYQNKDPFPYSNDLCDLFEDPDLARKYWMKPIKIFNICQTEDEELMMNKDELAAVAQLVMKYIVYDNFKKPFTESIAPLMQRLHLKDTPGAKRLMKQAVEYIYKKADYASEQKFVSMIHEIDKDLEDTVVSLAEQLSEKKLNEGLILGLEKGLEKGRQEGIREGIQEGIQQGEQLLLSRMIKNGTSYAKISELTGLSAHEIQSIVGF